MIGLEGPVPEREPRPPRSGVSPVVDTLVSLVGPASVVDVGASDTTWAAEFRAAGVADVLLVRPPRHHALAEAAVPVVVHDPRLPLALDRRFDLAVCIGAGDHLPPAAAGVLARTLADAAGVVAFAAAMPGLVPPGSGDGRWPAWWDSVFADVGYEAHDVVRPRLWNDDAVNVGIRQSLVLYAPPRRFAAAALPAAVQRSVVHPEAYHLALEVAGARRKAEAALAAARAIELEAGQRRLERENAQLRGDVQDLRGDVAELEAGMELARRERAVLRAGRAAGEVDLSRAPSPAHLVAATHQRATASIARSVTTAFPVRRRLRRLIGPPALLWDEAFYVSRTPEVLAAAMSPLLHYRRHGARQGRSPHPWFDPEWYAARNPGVVTRGVDPVEHYLGGGWRDGCDPHPLFASRWYGREHAAGDGWSRSPLEHYLERGRAAALPPHPLLDTRWYLAANPDVAGAGHDAVDHFCRHGWREDRDPHPLFDVDWYLERNPDVAGAGVNPLVHFLWFGWRERRDPHPLFDTAAYLAAHPDLERGGMDPLSHYVTAGAAAGASTGRFDTAWYVERHPEAADSGRNPLVFFVETGRARGDAPGPGDGPPAG